MYFHFSKKGLYISKLLSQNVCFHGGLIILIRSFNHLFFKFCGVNETTCVTVFLSSTYLMIAYIGKNIDLRPKFKIFTYKTFEGRNKAPKQEFKEVLGTVEWINKV